MSAMNKYGELEGDACPECGDPIKPQWVACPACGGSLRKRNSNKSSTKQTNSRYICPGCGKRATACDSDCDSDAGEGFLCKTCDAFVHHACGKRKVIKPYVASSLFAAGQSGVEQLLCPVCNSIIQEWS